MLSTILLLSLLTDTLKTGDTVKVYGKQFVLSEITVRKSIRMWKTTDGTWLVEKKIFEDKIKK